jgi:acyl-CoA thioester hydrolase
MVIVKIGVRYRRPAKYDDVLTLRTRTTRSSGAKIEHVYQLLRGDEVIAEGDSTLACVDRAGKVQRVPDWLRLDDEELAK